MNRNIFAVASLPVGFALFAGFGSIGWMAATVQAATLTQDFEIVVDRLTLPPGVTVPPPSVPPIGTRGQGRLTFDTNQIRYEQLDQAYYPGYFVYLAHQPTSFSLDFFGNHYTSVPVGGSTIVRASPSFIFIRTETGGYEMSSIGFITTDRGLPGLGIGGLSNTDYGRFTYYAGAGLADGSVTFSGAEAIPEPTTIAGVPVAIAISWACHRRFKRRFKKR